MMELSTKDIVIGMKNPPAQRFIIGNTTLKSKYFARLRVRGEGVYTGELESLNFRHCTLVVSCPPQTETRCFLWVECNGTELYSRGRVIKSDFNRVTIGLENGISLYRTISRHEAMSESSTLKQLQMVQASNRVLKGIESQSVLPNERKLNCWEVHHCDKAFNCSAATSTQFDGLFGGQNGGRFCAFIDGTRCKDGLPLSGEEKLTRCAKCSFYKDILRDAVSN